MLMRAHNEKNDLHSTTNTTVSTISANKSTSSTTLGDSGLLLSRAHILMYEYKNTYKHTRVVTSQS